jgi:hypothetical protein
VRRQGGRFALREARTTSQGGHSPDRSPAECRSPSGFARISTTRSTWELGGTQAGSATLLPSLDKTLSQGLTHTGRTIVCLRKLSAEVDYKGALEEPGRMAGEAAVDGAEVVAEEGAAAAAGWGVGKAGDPKGNAMIEPVGGQPPIRSGRGGVDTNTRYHNGSNYQRLNPQGLPTTRHHTVTVILRGLVGNTGPRARDRRTRERCTSE